MVYVYVQETRHETSTTKNESKRKKGENIRYSYCPTLLDFLQHTKAKAYAYLNIISLTKNIRIVNVE